MPEIKHNFTSGKMNKDLDERLVPNGEYRDALNLQVSVSEGSDVGAIENILGNYNITPNYFDPSAKCIASIADEKLDKLYWFVTSLVMDRIIQYDVSTGVVTDVVRDPNFNCLMFSGANRIITGVNVIDGMLFWTDNNSEPKKININRCIAGDSGIAGSQTLLVNLDRGIGPGLIVVPLQESHITVIRKSPKNPLTITPKTSRDPLVNYSGIFYTATEALGVPNGSSIINSVPPNITATNHYDMSGVEIGDSVYLIINTDLTGSNTFSLDATSYAVGKKVYLKEFDSDSIGGTVSLPPIPTTDYRIIARIEAWVGIPGTSLISAAPANSAASAWPISAAGTAHLKLKILTIDGYPPPPDPNVNGGVLPWVIDAWDDEQNLFEFKFPRFSYRYKYEDGEYSTFAPFSNIVFLPGSFDYHIKKGYNLGMTNRLTSIDVKDFVTQDMPEDVVELDLLYKEDGSPNIYVVETFSPIDEIPVGAATNNWYANSGAGAPHGQYTVTSDTIYAILPSNQLLRPWDNVPRKALAQEVVGNRLVYANYIQNFDLKSGVTIKEYYPDFTVAIGSFIVTPVTAGFGFKSIKTLRDYQVGVVFIDEYGRETPVLSNETGTTMLKKNFSASQNRFDIAFQAGSQFPPNMKYMKFFVKETSGEYYNLAMGRYYDAEDGNIWLSFPSTDRAKIDEESFIILKKGSDSNIPVTEPARYKVIAIENDAPDFIKTVKIRIDQKDHSYIAATGQDLFGADMTEAPGVGDDYFSMWYSPFMSSSSARLQDIMKDTDDQIWVDFEMSTAGSGRTSNRYRVTQLECDYNPAVIGGLPVVGSAAAKYYFKIEGIFGDDINFICDDPTGVAATQINEGARINIYRYKVENRPQFDGRFFVKILNDDIFTKYVSSSYAALSNDFKIVSSKKIYGLQDNVLNKHAYDHKILTGHGAENLTPEISAFLYNYNDLGWAGGSYLPTPHLAGTGWGEKNDGSLGHFPNVGGTITDPTLVTAYSHLYGVHEHGRVPDKNRFQAWFNKFRFFDAHEWGSDAGGLNPWVGSGSIAWDGLWESSEFVFAAGLPTGLNPQGNTPTNFAVHGFGFQVANVGTSGAFSNPYGSMYENMQDIMFTAPSYGYMPAVNWVKDNSFWFLDGGRHQMKRIVDNDMGGAGGVQMGCGGGSLNTNLGANLNGVFPSTLGVGWHIGSPGGLGAAPASVGGQGNPNPAVNSGCWWGENLTGASGTRSSTNVHPDGWTQDGHKSLSSDNFLLNLGHGGIYTDQWVHNPLTAAKYNTIVDFYDLRSGGNPNHPLETDFISKLIPGTRWRWAEDPAQTTYIVGGAVEEYGAFRYMGLPHSALGRDHPFGHDSWNMPIGTGSHPDAPAIAASMGAGWNAVNGFTNPANHTKNFIFSNEDTSGGAGGVGGGNWLPVRKQYNWIDGDEDMIVNDGYSISVTTPSAGTTAQNTTTNLDNYYLELDSLIGANTGAGPPNVAIHKGLVLYSATGVQDSCDANDPSSPDCSAAAINFASGQANINYPTAANTFWQEYITDPGGLANSIKWQPLLVKQIAYDAATGKYHVYLTGYRRTMTKYDTINPSTSSTLVFKQPKMNGFSSNFVENFHWMAWKWNNTAGSPWNPANFNGPLIFERGHPNDPNVWTHFEHGHGFNVGEYPDEDVRLFDAVSYTIEILEPLGDIETYADDPAIWETEPKEVSDLNIYYEASGYNPMILDGTTKYTAIPNGSTVTRLGGIGMMPNTTTTLITGINNDQIVVTDPLNVTGSICTNGLLGCPANGVPNSTNIGDTLNITKLDGSIMTATVMGFPNPPINIGGENFRDAVTINTNLYNESYSLNWSNCYSYGNGVESNRIRDYFNLPFISNGVFVSATLGEQYKEERRTNGLMYSGLYNSISGVNNLNQFIQAEKITKDINPSYGSIQKLHARDTDLVTLCEDKVLKILANKDAVYNADGNTQLTATANVLGQSVPFVGEYGISTNPESFASESYRAYFSDKVRGVVMRLSKDGLTPISSHGMKDWFKDNLKTADVILGSYDDNKDQYNITLNYGAQGTLLGIQGQVIDTCKGRSDIDTGTFILTTIPDPGVTHNLLTWVDYYTDTTNGISGQDIRDFKYEYQSVACDNNTLASPCCSVPGTPAGPPGTWYAKNTHIGFGWYPNGIGDCSGPILNPNVSPPPHQCGCYNPNGQTTWGSIAPPWLALGGFGSSTYFVWDDILTQTMANLPAAGVTMNTNISDYITIIEDYYQSLNPQAPRPHLEWCTQGSPCLCDGPNPPPSQLGNSLLSKTLTFKENVKGWTSFKSFIPEHAVSCASQYFTFNSGNLYQHHHMLPSRNNFYGQQYQSSFKVLMNDGAGSVKNFQTVNYEGSNTRIRKFTTQNVTDIYGVTTTYNDKEYYNLTSRPGWWVQKIQTDLQQGAVPEFIEKEGKWFNYIKGPFLNDWAMPQFDEFAAQGIGGFEDFNPNIEVIGCMDNTSMVNFNPLANVPCQDVNGVFNGTAADANGVYTCCEPCIYGCMDPTSNNYNPAATCDDGSCFIPGCTDPTAINYNPLANVDDGSCILPVCGCMDNTQVFGEDASFGYGGGPIGFLVNQYLNFNPLANCDCDCDCAPGIDVACCDPAIYGCMDPTALNFMPSANIQSNVPCTSYIDANGILQWQQNYCDCLDFIYGCTDSIADNYDPTATIPCDASGTGPGNNECCTYTISGCMDINSTTYDPTATVDDPLLCEYAGCLDITASNYGMFDVNDSMTYTYGGTTYTISDITSSCISCCEYDVLGCTDPTATNYDPTATVDDGSCIYSGCTDPNAINYSATATVDDGSCLYTCTTCESNIIPTIANLWSMDPSSYTPITNIPTTNVAPGVVFSDYSQGVLYYTDPGNGISNLPIIDMYVETTNCTACEPPFYNGPPVCPGPNSTPLAPTCIMGLTGAGQTPNILLHWNGALPGMSVGVGSCSTMGGTSGMCRQIVVGHPMYTQCTTPPIQSGTVVFEVFDGSGNYCNGWPSWDAMITALQAAGYPVAVGTTHYGMLNGTLLSNLDPNHLHNQMQQPSAAYPLGNTDMQIWIDESMNCLAEVVTTTPNPQGCPPGASGP